MSASSKYLKQHYRSRCCRVFMSYHTPQNLTWGGAVLPHPGGNRHVMAWPRNGFWKNTNFYGIDLSAAVQRCAKPLEQSWVLIIFCSLCLSQEDPKLQNLGSAKTGIKTAFVALKSTSLTLHVYLFIFLDLSRVPGSTSDSPLWTTSIRSAWCPKPSKRGAWQ